jgi:tetratricopeptide (TPR) repeat protein
VKFVDEFPKSEFAAIAMFNAMDIYDGALKLDIALTSALHLLDKYPKEINEGALKEAKVEEKVRLNLVRYYEKIADYETSAKRAGEFVDKYPKHTKAPDVLYNSGIFYLGLGDTTNAVKAFARYLKEYPTQFDVADVYLRMTTVFEDGGEWAKAISLYEGFEKTYGKQAKPDQILNSRYKTALMQQKAGRVDQMMETCKGILSSVKRAELKKSDIGQLAGGYCAFHGLDPEYEAFKAIRIESKETGKTSKR